MSEGTMRELLQRAGFKAPDTGPPRGPSDPGRYRSVLIVEQYADSLAEAKERTRALVRAAQRVNFRIVEQGEAARVDGPFTPDLSGGPAAGEGQPRAGRGDR